jgi:hypothetical protein
LEVLKTPGGFVTTRSAYFRLLHRLNPSAPQGLATPARARREHQQSERELDALGVA